MPVRRLLCIAASASLLVGIAACGPEGTDEPPTASGSQSSDGGGTTTEEASSSTPSDGGGEETSDGEQGETAAPDVPEPDPADFPGMDKHTDKGAEQAFRYYWAMLIWGYQTGETSKFEHLYREPCDSCSKNAQQMDIRGKQDALWSRTALKDVLLKSKSGDRHEIEVSYVFVMSAHNEPATTERDPVSEPKTKYASVGGMNWTEGRWTVDAVGFATEELGE